VPLSLSAIEIAFGMLFLAGFLYCNYPWLYAKLLNISQPYKKTVLMYKSKSLIPSFKSIEEASQVVGKTWPLYSL
jgi:hypothetical protein